MSTLGAVLAAKNLDSPDEVRDFAHGHMDIVQVAGRTVGRMVFEPGWRWSVHMRPTAGTDSCRVLHTGAVLSGRLAVRMDDGTEAVAGPGDVFVIEPGHDGWVLGDEPCVLLDWTGAGGYARH
ncbi:cupin domain-containing protein [Paeniglutamicibacter psychrophenolicus]|uniref:cupin domain-containing protein n=1 Tax=Paeniglutamicibacter psychrophenolicus TaxID=257454 RepID=UPI00278A1FF8|nr:cupin domain-containing protein [Paeniglutamicibacter psychrophenolicus]MDQ0092213.1 quercetin dioxygenase-like cupin family protein [Paeniglutamicibacter psychrophenolicus]